MKIHSPATSTLTATRRLGQVGRARSDTLRHLSSGVTVTEGVDAPAALIAKQVLRQDRTRAEAVSDATRLVRGATDAAEATLAEVNAHLRALRALAGASHGNTIGPEERAAN